MQKSSQEFNETNQMIRKLEEKLKECIVTQQKINENSQVQDGLHMVTSVVEDSSRARNHLLSTDSVKVKHYLDTNHQTDSHYTAPPLDRQYLNLPPPPPQSISHISNNQTSPPAQPLLYHRKNFSSEERRESVERREEPIRRDESGEHDKTLIDLEHSVLSLKRQLGQKEKENEQLRRTLATQQEQLQNQAEKYKARYKAQLATKKTDYRQRYEQLLREKDKHIAHLESILGRRDTSLTKPSTPKARVTKGGILLDRPEKRPTKRARSRSIQKNTLPVGPTSYKMELMELKKENQEQFSRFKQDLDQIKTQLCIHR